MENMEIDNNFAYLDTVILESLMREEGQYMELSKEVAKDVQSKNLTILELIQKLECLLLNQSFSKRDIGVLLLSETLHNLEDGNLNPEQLALLSAYFCEKLKDHHQVATSALKGVLALISFSNIQSESIIQLISSIFNHITCQQQQQQDRYLIFQIYETVLKQHSHEVHSMGIDFVYGVISSIDGERDPKNLIYLFNWLQTFLKTVKLGHLTEEMFEVLSCYFPVDFKAPPSDKNKITREDLAQGLCECLTCIPDFGQHGIPLALEKLDSALKIAKEDSLDILKSGCKNYDTQIYYENSIEIWSHIQKEVFSASDFNLRHKCLETLKEIITKLSQGDQQNFENTILDIADTLRGNILPDSKLFSQSSQILVYVAQASKVSSVLVAKKVTPFLENTFKITTNPKHKAVILHTFVEFVKAVIETDPTIDLSSLEEIASCPSLCSQAIVDKDPDLAIAGYRGFTEITQFVPDNLRQIYLQTLSEAVIAPLPDSVKLVVFKSLERIADIFPQEVERHVLRKEALCDIVSVDNYLAGLSNIVQLPYFEDYVLDTYINYSIEGVNSSTVALKHLNNIISKFTHINSLLIQKNFIAQLIDFLVKLEDTELLTKEFLGGVNLVLQRILRTQDVPVQKDIYLVQTGKNFKSRNVYVTVISGLVVPMQRGVFEDYEKIDFLFDCSLNATEEFVRNISLESLANVLNKLDNDLVLEDKLDEMKILCGTCNKDTLVLLIAWITKSLVTRNHLKAFQWTDLLLDCLQNNIKAAKGFSIIMDETYRVISKENYCQIMPLYKQKFFIYCTNKLNAISLNDDDDDDALLNAVGYLIENAPKLAVIGSFKKILRLILLCLEKGKEPGVLEIILQRIREFVVTGERVIEDNLEDILFRVLNLTTCEASMIVRIAAIRCLHQITVTYKVYKLLPFKQRVIQQLGICVDDRKRLVRREAMECRSFWYLLDAPE